MKNNLQRTWEQSIWSDVGRNPDFYVHQLFRILDENEMNNLDDIRNERLQDPYKKIRENHRQDLN